jgi:hypothetical protein
MSVGGPWTIGLEGAQSGASSCDSSGTKQAESLKMQVEQAGRQLRVRIEGPGNEKKTVLSGALRDGVADVRAKSDNSSIVSMRAEVDPGGGHESMTGTLRLASCSGETGGTEARFRARRDGTKEVSQ